MPKNREALKNSKKVKRVVLVDNLWEADNRMVLAMIATFMVEEIAMGKKIRLIAEVLE